MLPPVVGIRRSGSIPHPTKRPSARCPHDHAPLQRSATPPGPHHDLGAAAAPSRTKRGARARLGSGDDAASGGRRDTEHTRRTRLGGGVEAAGRGGAGKRTVRQRDPTWALRCPAFPSLKYYSVRRERELRSPASFAAVFTPRATHSRHPLVTDLATFAFTEGLDADAELVFFCRPGSTATSPRIICPRILRAACASKRKR